jgi:hypothetical protein
MIESVKIFRHNVERFQSSLPDVVLESVKDNEHYIVDLNTEDQLFQQGIDSDGSQVGPGYAPLTITIKRQKGQPTDRVTLRDTGDFHKSFKISYGADSFAIMATDPKSRELEQKYGREIFGLTDDSVAEATEIVRPEIFTKSKEIILSNLD